MLEWFITYELKNAQRQWKCECGSLIKSLEQEFVVLKSVNQSNVVLTGSSGLKKPNKSHVYSLINRVWSIIRLSNVNKNYQQI